MSVGCFESHTPTRGLGCVDENVEAVESAAVVRRDVVGVGIVALGSRYRRVCVSKGLCLGQTLVICGMFNGEA